MAGDYFSFDEALSELQMDEVELQTLVSRGELRAFRDEDTLKFRKTDVYELKKARETEPTIILPGELDEGLIEVPTEGEAGEPDLAETELSLDILGEDDTSAPTELAPDAPTIDETVGIEIQEEDTSAPTELEAESEDLDETVGLDFQDEEIDETAATEIPSLDLSDETAPTEAVAEEMPEPSLEEDTDDTEIGLSDFEEEEIELDETAETVVPTIELSSEDLEGELLEAEEAEEDTTATVVPTIELSADEVSLADDALSLSEDEVSIADEEVGEELAIEDDLISDDAVTDEMAVLDDEPSATAVAGETVADEDDALGFVDDAATAPLDAPTGKLADGATDEMAVATAELGEEIAEAEFDEEEEEEERLTGVSRSRRLATAERPPGSPLFTAIMGFCVLVLLAAGILFYGAIDEMPSFLDQVMDSLHTFTRDLSNGSGG